MISYSTHREDVVLCNVFADVGPGHYIDVGASMARVASNSFALYERGWRGLVIDPLFGIFEAFKAEWQEWRPRDCMIEGVVGSHAGRVILHVFEKLQLATAAPLTVALWAAQGTRAPVTVEVPQFTLDDLIGCTPGLDYQLLLVDAEGMEGEVLAGLDLARHRPWVIVAEVALSPVGWPWVTQLLNCGYRIEYRDGTNYYFLADEHTDLASRFVIPPGNHLAFEATPALLEWYRCEIAKTDILGLCRASASADD